MRIKQVEGSPRKVEVEAIAHYKNVVMKKLYNLNKGGGGPSNKENLPPPKPHNLID